MTNTSDLRPVEFNSLTDLAWELAKPKTTPRIVGVRGPKDKGPRYVDAPGVSKSATKIVARYRDTGKTFVFRRKHFGLKWTVWLPDGNELTRVIELAAADPPSKRRFTAGAVVLLLATFAWMSFLGGPFARQHRARKLRRLKNE